MSSLDRIGQLQAAKAFLRFCKQSTSSTTTTSISGSNGMNKRTTINSISDLNRIIAQASNSPPFILKRRCTSSDNYEKLAQSSLVPINSSTSLLNNDVLNYERKRFTIPSHVQESPKFKNVRIIELEGNWKYWIPTKRVKFSNEDIIVKLSQKNDDSVIIVLPSHAPSSYNRSEFLKSCKSVKFGNEALTFHETRKLPKEVKSNIFQMKDPLDVKNEIEHHLTPISTREVLSDNIEKLNRGSTNDCIMLFSAQNGNSPHLRFDPGKKCPPGKFNDVANAITDEMINFSVPGRKMDFSFYDQNVKFVYDNFEGKQRVLAWNLKQYSRICNSWRLYFVSTKVAVACNVLRLTPEHDKSKICVRWRVKSLSVFR